MTPCVLVTGGVFIVIGAVFMLWLAQSDDMVVTLDKLTSTGNLETLASLEGDPIPTFARQYSGGSLIASG